MEAKLSIISFQKLTEKKSSWIENGAQSCVSSRWLSWRNL